MECPLTNHFQTGLRNSTAVRHSPKTAKWRGLSMRLEEERALERHHTGIVQPGSPAPAIEIPRAPCTGPRKSHLQS
jgi:hypothetical protein